jgi:dienelactone hydrolase
VPYAASTRPGGSRPHTLATRALAILTACVLVGDAASAYATEQPLEYYTRRAEVDDVAISPNGKLLAAALASQDRSRVAILRLPDLKTLATLDAGDGLRIGQMLWLSGDRLAYTLRAIEPARLRRPPAGELFSLRLRSDGTEVDSFRFTQGKDYASADILGLAAEGGERLLVSEHAWLRSDDGYRYDADAQPAIAVIDTRAATRTVIDRLPLSDASALIDEQGRARFATGFDSAGKRDLMWKHDAAWTPFRVPGFRAETVTPRQYSDGGHTLVFTGAPERESTIGLYRFDTASGAVTKLYAHPQADVAETVFDLSDERLIGARVEAERPEYHWLDGESRAPKIYELLEKAFPQHDVRITSAAANAQLATAFVRSDTDPGAWYVVDTAKRNADFLFASHPWIDPAQSRAVESISLHARDGTPLHAYLTRPRDGAGPFPLVIAVHPDPYETRAEWGYDWEAQLLANHGYAVLRVNYRGSTGYGEDFRVAGYGQWGAKMQDDLTDATHWAIDQGIAAKDNICILGSGYGGYAALMGAVREPALYRCVASYGGITDLEQLLDRDSTMRSVAGRAAIAAAVGTDRATLRAVSPARNAERIQAHVLLIHDEDDPVVNYAHATYMNQALLAAGKVVRLESTSSGAHELYTQAQRDEVWAKLLGLLHDELRGGRLPVSASVGR